MLRPKLADLAREAKKIKTAPIKAAAGSGGKQQQRPRPGGLAHFRVLESPGCRRVVLTGPTGRLDGKAAESLTWKMRAWENNYLVKAVILHGRREGKFYSGGWEHGHSAAGPEGQHQTRLQALQRYSQLAYLLATLSKPTIAWLNGEVRGSGLGLGLARLRVATRSSSFHVDAAKRGWALDGGLSFALPRLRAGADGSVVGGPASLALARYLALTGGVLKGADMLACGMATHMMDDAAAAAIHKRLADLTYEPDHMVEEALSEHATVFYKMDARLNPGPYRDLWAEWARNDEAREQMMRAAAGDGASVGGGGAIFADEEGEDADDEGENPLGADDEEESGWVRQKEEAEAAVGEEEELGMGEGLHAKLDMKQMLARQGLLEEDDAAGGERGRGRGGKQQQQRAADSEMEGSLWWHRNFAPGDEALMRAQAEIIENEMAEEVLSDAAQAALRVAGKFTDGRFPEYFTYPERRLLVESDGLLLAPWACSVDRAQTFPKFLELSGKVQRCFGAGKGSVEEVVEALKADGSSWAEECLANMDAASPLSLRLAFQQLEASTASEIEGCFRSEFRVGARLLRLQQQPAAAEGALMPGGALARLAEASVGQAEEMVAKPLEEEKDGGVEELFLPERVAGEVRDRDAGSKVERRYARVGTTRGSV